MTSKEEKILEYIKDQLSRMEKFGNEQEEMLNSYRKDKDEYNKLHPFHRDEMKSGISYSHGYATGFKCLSNDIINMIEMSEEELDNMFLRNEEIERENKEYLDSLLEEIKSRRKEN